MLRDRLVIERLRGRVPVGAAGEFSSPELTLCADCFSVSVPLRFTPVKPERPRPFCQKCRWQVTPKHTYTLDPTSWSGLTIVSRHSVGTYQGNEPTRNSSRSTRPQSSELAEPLRTDPGQESGICVRELISTSKKKKKKRKEKRDSGGE